MPDHRRVSASVAKLVLIAASVLPISACKVVSIEADRESRERQSASFDADAHVAKIWALRVLPTVEGAAVDIAALNSAREGNFASFAREHGRQAGEGSPWTFSVRGGGTVVAVDRTSRRGSITLALADGAPLTIETGPVIIDATLRDALPFFDFNDFSDQVAYAAVSRALTERALADTAAVSGKAAPGMRLRFLGVVHVTEGDTPLSVLPIRLEALPK